MIKVTKKLMAIMLGIATISGSNYMPFDKVNAVQVKTQVEIKSEKDIAFQSEVLLIVEGAISKEYPRMYIADQEGNIAIMVLQDVKTVILI